MVARRFARILVPDNCKTAVVHNGGWKDQQINETYQEMAEHYGTAIIVSGRFVLDKTSLQELHLFGCLPTAKKYLIPVHVICAQMSHLSGASEPRFRFAMSHHSGHNEPLAL